MKRITLLFFACFICAMLSLPCFAVQFANPPLQDGADYLTESQFEEVSAKLERIRQKYDFEVAIVTEYRMSGTSVRSSADDIYDYGGFGAGVNSDGIMLYICAASRKYHITTHAEGRRVFNENGIKYLEKNIQPYLEEDDYYSAMVTFAELSDELLEEAEKGAPFDKTQHDDTYILIIIGSAILIPLLIAYLMMKRKLAKMKTAVENDYAANYVIPGSKQLDVSRDIFLYSRITKREKPESDSGMHRSSSGRLHGGGGGSF